MKLEDGKQIALFMLNAKMITPEGHPILTAECMDINVWKNRIENSNSLEEIIDLFKPKFKFKFIQLLKNSIDITYKDLGNLVIHCWNDISSFHYNLFISKEDFLRFIINSDYEKFMTESDLNLFHSLPDVVTVYRGATISTKLGMCWTLNKEIATRYAQDYQGDVYIATIARKYVIAYIQKDETIVLPYRRLQGMKKL